MTAFACDGLLDAAERGMERTPPTGVIVMSTPEEWQAYGAGRDSMKEELTAERDAAVAERDELRKDWCQKCGRKFATVNDFRALTRDSRAADGLCPTRYAFRDPDAQKDCDAASEARRLAQETNDASPNQKAKVNDE